MTHGCCVDKICNEATCMRLPEGVHCGDCAWFGWCAKVVGKVEASEDCDFFPQRFARTRLEALSVPPTWRSKK